MTLRVSIGVPIYNEEAVIPALLARTLTVLDAIPGGPHELLVVDDGSRDGSQQLLTEAAARDPRVRVIVFSRNFGHQAAVSAVYDHCQGDVLLVMDGDLQDPPEVLPLLLERMREGFDVVYSVRQGRKESLFLRASYHVAYRLIARLSRLALPPDAGDFALLSRRAVDAVRALPERQRYLRGLRSWVGFRQSGVPIERDARAAGDSKYSLGALIGLALDGAFAFSTAPLRFIGVLGALVTAGGALYAAYAILAKIAFGQPPQGFTALTVLLTSIGGMILLSLWIIGEYIGRTYEEVKRRPVYVIDRIVGAPETANR